MGYAIHVISALFTIPPDKTVAALAAVRQLAGQETCGATEEKHFMWIQQSSAFVSASSLEEALEAWRWRAQLDGAGGVAELEFLGDNLGDEDLLFRALAPYVDDGSSIVVVGEDGAIWRWHFRNGAVSRQDGVISFIG